MAYWDDAFSVRPHILRLTVTEGTKNVANNTTVVNWNLKVIQDTRYTPYGSDGSRTVSVNGGSAFAGTFSYNFASYDTLTLASGSKTITHNADGTKTIPVSASASMGSAAGTAAITTKNMVLTPIPRATDPVVTPVSGNTGQTFTIEHDPAASTFFHDLAYSLDGGATYTDIVTDLPGTDLSTDWTPPHSLLPDTTSATATIRLITRSGSGGTIIGTKTTGLPLTVPASVKPAVTSVSWTDAQTSAPDLPTLMGGAGRFVQRWSKLQPSVGAAGAGGSTIVSRSVLQNGQVTDSGVPFAVPIAISGAVPFTATVIDSRGVTSDPYVNTVDVAAYNYPNLPTPLIARTSDAAGATPSPTGTYLSITPAASVSSLIFGGSQKNLLEYRIRIKAGAGSYVTVQDWLAVAGTTWTAKRIFGGYSPAVEYTVEVSIRDLFGKNGYTTASTVKTLTVLVPSESVFMDWNGQAGLGLFKYHANGVLDVGGDIYMNGVKVATVNDTPPDASTTVKGIVELATNAETSTGTDTVRAVTPAGLTAALAAPLDRVTVLERDTRRRIVPVAESGCTVSADGTVSWTTQNIIRFGYVHPDYDTYDFEFFFDTASVNTYMRLLPRTAPGGTDLATGLLNFATQWDAAGSPTAVTSTIGLLIGRAQAGGIGGDARAEVRHPGTARRMRVFADGVDGIRGFRGNSEAPNTNAYLSASLSADGVVTTSGSLRIYGRT